MAKLFWHNIRFLCLKCREPLRIVKLLASADGEILVESYCDECRYESPPLKTDMGKILTFCRAKDKDQPENKGKPLKSPLALPPGLTPDDKKFLSDFHISEGEG